MPRSLTPQIGLFLTISVQGRVAFCGPKRMGFLED
jgi:hypothetical protein